jgi:hypothetical protein
MNEEIKLKIRKEGNLKWFFKDGYMCMLIRPHFAQHFHWDTDKSLIFNLNGYVGVPKGHKLYKKHYDTLNEISIHGGLTYSGWLCGDKTYWFFGFDTAHSGDLCMDMSDYIDDFDKLHQGDTYKDEEYVMKEIKSLLRQLKRRK